VFIKGSREHLRRPYFAINRFSGYQHKLWLIGDGRSGTTWLSNLINYDNYFRNIYEPFHPQIVPQANFLSSHHYERPSDENQHLHKFAEEVFAGCFWHPRTDSDNTIRIYKGLLIKDIFANLLSYWVHNNFRDVKTILLIRNPFAVAMSKYMKKNWTWVTDPISLLNQSKLRDDYLQEFKELIFETSKKNDFILNQILIWSIIHYVPFRQFNSDQIHLMFYEDVFANPVGEISKLENYVGKEFNDLPKHIIEKPSKVGGFNLERGMSPITSWKNDIPTSIIDQGYKILERFGLENLYNEKSLPNKFNFDKF
jgi:hypothetical protein